MVDAEERRERGSTWTSIRVVKRVYGEGGRRSRNAIFLWKIGFGLHDL
jgi:hypothetical protein